MSLPSSMLPTTCDVYRPFGAGSPTTTGIACRLVADPVNGKSASPLWTHYIDVDESADIRDGATRTAGTNLLNYADGDELRIPDASGTRFVVVWVESRNVGTASAFKRVYLMRHA